MRALQQPERQRAESDLLSAMRLYRKALGRSHATCVTAAQFASLRHRIVAAGNEFSKSTENLAAKQGLILGQRVANIGHEYDRTTTKDYHAPATCGAAVELSALRIHLPCKDETIAHWLPVLHCGNEFPHFRAAQHEHIRHPLRRSDKACMLDASVLGDEHFDGVGARRPSSDGRCRQLLRHESRRQDVRVVPRIDSLIDKRRGFLARSRKKDWRNFRERRRGRPRVQGLRPLWRARGGRRIVRDSGRNPLSAYCERW